MSRNLILRILLALLLTSAPTFAQSLADVLSSIQERKQALEQRNQVGAHLQRTYTTIQPEIPTQVLIVWDDLGLEFPTDSDTEALEIDARINLLNQAIRELRKLQTSYLNFRKEDLEANAKAGALRPYMLEDFPDPGRAGAGNYHQVLRLVAQSVRRLSVLEWPLAGRKKVVYTSLNNRFAGYPPDPTWEISNLGTLAERCHFQPTYDQVQEDHYYEQVGLHEGVPNAEGQISGKVAVIFKNQWSSISWESEQMTAPTSWKPNDGSCQVALSEDSPSDEYPMDAPDITFGLEANPFPTPWPWVPNESVYPTGYQVVDWVGNCAETSWEDLLGVADIPESPGPNSGYYIMGRRMHALFAPQFTQGLDSSGKAAMLDKSERATAGPPGDAVPLLHPTPGMLMGIPLGVGLDGGSIGYIGITPGEADRSLIGYSSQNLQMPLAIPDVIPTSSELANRFDYAASLRFLGPVQDFHVVYETSRETAKRGAALPDAVPTAQEITDMGCKFFFRNWDLPRLKQVVSRDFIVNITPQGHYKNKVEIYRRPANAGAVDRTPGQAVTDLSGAQLIRTLVLENPDAANEPYPDTPENLQITDSGTTYKIWRTGYPASAQKTSGTASVVHPDLNFEIKVGETVRYAKYMNFNGIGYVTTATSLDGVTVSTETINDEDWAWFLGMEPSNRTMVRGAQTTSVTSTHAANPSPWFSSYRYEWHPLTSHITITNEPDTDFAWTSSGRLTSAVQGSWKTDYSIEAGALKAESKFNNTTYATAWTEWSNHDRTITTYSAPDGTTSYKNDSAVDYGELTLGNTSGTGLPGRPHKLTRKDGSETEWDWYISTDQSNSSVTIKSGLFFDGYLQTGLSRWTAWNNRGYLAGTSTDLISNETVMIASAWTAQSTAWGAPEQWEDGNTGLFTAIAYEPGLNRPSSITSPLGLSTTLANYDVFDRPGQMISNGITGTTTYGALSTTTTYGGADLVSGSQSSYTRNVEGIDVTTGLTWGGVGQSQNMARGASSTSITGSHSLLGASSAELRKEDGSLATADDDTLAFGGVAGDALSVVDGLLVTKSAVAGQTDTFVETHSDAWGRTRKIVTPSKSGSGSTQTTYDYSLPSNPLKRIITTESSGRILITESDAAGTITRSGIDLDGNDSLGSSDRYTESSTTVENGLVVTTLRVTENTGLREVLRSEWGPSSGMTVTTINGNEENITTAQNYGAKTVTAFSNKGWERTTALNNLGLATTNTLSGTGISNTELKPVWRSDGSLASVELEIVTGPENQKETHSASFNPDGTLSSLTAPGRGNILGEHTISNGVENLTVNGVTMQASLDGTNQAISGANVIGRSEALTTNSGGFKNTTTPAMASGPLTIPSVGISFGYNRSGNISALSDPSGTRALSYQKGRLVNAIYTAGILKGYEVIPGRDSVGRHNGTLLKRDGATIHATAKAPNGVSDQITNLTSGNLTATPQRDGVGRINGYVWSDGSNSVTQTWARGPGGRIETAGSDVPGAPSFGYLLDPENPAESFDGSGRRLKCTTAGGTWTYVYGAGGQLTSATHPTLGTFAYAFDGIGRRTDKGEANASDVLNRTTAWTHSQDKTLTIKAHQDARVWFNGVEIENFTGSHSAAITPPGTEGGWVPWETLAVLEGAGDGAGDPPTNPLASPDAKAEKKGAVWVPPTSEEITYDAAGNRESSAQWDFGWDAKNQLARARTKNHSAAAQGYDITYSYDSEGRRVKKHVIEYLNGTQVSEKIITFVWDGWDLLYERHQLPSGLTLLERKYLWGPDIADGSAGGAGGLLLIRETKGNTTKDIIPLYDGGGNVIALTDINKNLLAAYCHGPFGEKISATDPNANSNPWRWATKYFDEETGLYYFGHRFYDPITGQFISRDPRGEKEGPNLFQYCGGDPINYVDRFGLAKVATDGRGNLTEIGKVIVAIAQEDPEAARSLLMAAQVNAELGGAKLAELFGDGGKNAIDSVLRAIENVVVSADLDGRQEWKSINARAGLTGEGHFSGQFKPALAALKAQFSPVIAQAQRQHDINRLFEKAGYEIQQEFQNSFGYKTREIGLATADLPMHLGAAVVSGAMATDVTTGNAITWSGWGNGFGIQEVTPGERAFAVAMVFLPVGRAGGLVDDVARVGGRINKQGMSWAAIETLEEISPRTSLMRDRLVKNMAKEMGYDPTLVTYRHWAGEMGGSITGGFLGSPKMGTIVLDGFAFDDVYLRMRGISGPREILAHEIGHNFVPFGAEAGASTIGATLPGLSRNQIFNLFKDASSRK